MHRHQADSQHPNQDPRYTDLPSHGILLVTVEGVDVSRDLAPCHDRSRRLEQLKLLGSSNYTSNPT